MRGGLWTCCGMLAGMDPTVPQVAPADLTDDVVLLDVREDDEWRAGHIEGAVHVPLGQLGRRLDELPRDRSVVALCRVGPRSEQATAGLRERGYDVRNLTGGMTRWAAEGRPMVSETGATPAVI